MEKETTRTELVTSCEDTIKDHLLSESYNNLPPHLKCLADAAKLSGKGLVERVEDIKESVILHIVADAQSYARKNDIKYVKLIQQAERLKHIDVETMKDIRKPNCRGISDCHCTPDRSPTYAWLASAKQSCDKLYKGDTQKLSR